MLYDRRCLALEGHGCPPIRQFALIVVSVVDLYMLPSHEASLVLYEAECVKQAQLANNSVVWRFLEYQNWLVLGREDDAVVIIIIIITRIFSSPLQWSPSAMFSASVVSLLTTLGERLLTSGTCARCHIYSKDSRSLYSLQRFNSVLIERNSVSADDEPDLSSGHPNF